MPFTLVKERERAHCPFVAMAATHERGTTMNASLNDALEALVDRYGMSQVLFSLAAVCYEKEDHIRTNWQDKVTARAWHSDAVAVENLAAKIRTI